MASNLDILSMSDEEFAQLSAPPESTEAKTSSATTAEGSSAETDAQTETEKPVLEEAVSPKDEPTVESESESESEAKSESASEPTSAETGEDDKTVVSAVAPAVSGVFQDGKTTTPVSSAVTPASASKQEAKSEVADKSESDKTDKSTASTNDSAAVYKSFYERVMAPFKANGKLIQLQSVDEVVQLMQMGANYTKKMQALQPQKKFLMMLENNNLLDEEKISFLIDLDKKNPEAIKKLLKDANIDPIEVDTSKVNYRSGSHAVSDQEASLTSAIEDLNAQDGGSETLQSIQAWDAASKKALWANPELLSIFHAQRMNGIYDRITTEMERRKLIGQLSHSTPFLTAYKSIGDELAAQGVFQSAPNRSAPSGQQPVAGAPVAVRPAKTPVTKPADNRVKAAASTRTTPTTAPASVNYLAMSDEEFLKLANKV